MTDGTVLVDAPGAARRVEALGMRCDATEIPDPLGNEKPIGWWIVRACTMSGTASAGTLEGDATPIDMQGTAALAVLPGRLLGIFSTHSQADPAVWFSWPTPALHIETAGSQGLFKKRPTEITVGAPDCTLVLAQVNRLFRHSKSYQSGQENSFLDALGATA